MNMNTKNLKRVLTRSQIRKLILENKAAIKKLYLENDLTSKEIANMYNCQHSQAWNSELFRRIGSKNKGHGGARQNAGKSKIKISKK